MTTYLTKTALQQYLEDRIAELMELDRSSYDALHEQAMASELSSLLRLIGDGAFTVVESDEPAQQQDPIDELADLALHDHKAAVDRIQVAQVQPVLLELRNRVTEFHRQGEQAEKAAVLLAETVQSLVRERDVEIPMAGPLGKPWGADTTGRTF